MAWQNQYHASFFSFLPQIAVKKYLTVHFMIRSVSVTGIFAMCMHTRLYCKMMSVWYEELGKPDIREIGFWEERGEHRNLTLVWFLFMRSYSGCRLRHGLLGWKVVNLGVELITITVASRGLEGDSYRSHYRVAECNDRLPLRRLSSFLTPCRPSTLASARDISDSSRGLEARSYPHLPNRASLVALIPLQVYIYQYKDPRLGSVVNSRPGGALQRFGQLTCPCPSVRRYDCNSRWLEVTESRFWNSVCSPKNYVSRKSRSYNLAGTTYDRIS